MYVECLDGEGVKQFAPKKKVKGATNIDVIVPVFTEFKRATRSIHDKKLNYTVVIKMEAEKNMNRGALFLDLFSLYIHDTKNDI